MIATNKPARCLFPGELLYECTICGFRKSTTSEKDAPALGHDWEVTAVYNEGDCTHKYHATKTCKRCGTKEDIIEDRNRDVHDFETKQGMSLDENYDWWWYEYTRCKRCNASQGVDKKIRPATDEEIENHY